MNYYPIAMEEREIVKHGDVFTIKPDYNTDYWQMFMDGDNQKMFVAVPLEYEANIEVRKQWDAACKRAAKKGLKKVELQPAQPNSEVVND